MWPDLGDSATSFEVSLRSTDGVQEPMVWVKNVRADWPTPYVLRAPMPLARGTRIVMTAYLANASDKPITVTRESLVVTAP